jgi:hypothetical protein
MARFRSAHASPHVNYVLMRRSYRRIEHQEVLRPKRARRARKGSALRGVDNVLLADAALVETTTRQQQNQQSINYNSGEHLTRHRRSEPEGEASVVPDAQDSDCTRRTRSKMRMQNDQIMHLVRF